MDPNGRVLGPKCYNISGIWALKPYYLGPWTLSVLKYLQAWPAVISGYIRKRVVSAK